MKLFFLHIPKTGGASFHNYMSKNYYNSSSSIDIDGINNNNNIDCGRLVKTDFISGHFNFIDVEHMLCDYKFVTIFRNILDRCISWYRYSRACITSAVCVENKIISFEDMFNSTNAMNLKYVHNQMMWMLGNNVNLNKRNISEKECLIRAKENLHKFSDILFFDDLENNVNSFLVSNYKVVHGSFPHLNSTRKIDDPLWCDVELNDKIISKVQECNKYDIELYNYAKELKKNE